MKKHFLLLLALFTSISSFGCWVVSINPFYTADTIIQLNEIDGKWRLIESIGNDVKDKTIEAWTFSSPDNIIESFDENNRRGMLETVYFSIDGTKFIDFMPGDEECLNEYFAGMLYPVHNLCKIEFTGDTLKLIPLDYSYVVDYVRSGGETVLEYFQPDDEEQLILFTEEAAGWVGFLKRYKNSEGLFDYDNMTKLVRYGK